MKEQNTLDQAEMAFVDCWKAQRKNIPVRIKYRGNGFVLYEPINPRENNHALDHHTLHHLGAV